MELAENFSVILLRHVTNDRVNNSLIKQTSNIVESFLKFQDLNITIDQLDKKNIVDEDLMSRTLFIVNSKRCAHSMNPRRLKTFVLDMRKVSWSEGLEVLL